MSDYIFQPESLIETTGDYPQAPYFDIDKGDFAIDGKGDIVIGTPQQAMMNWCEKALNIPRYLKLAYSDNMGIELGPIELYTDNDSRISWLKRTIEETLLSDPLSRVSSVDKIEISFPEPDAVYLHVYVTAKKGLEPFEIEKVINYG